MNIENTEVCTGTGHEVATETGLEDEIVVAIEIEIEIASAAVCVSEAAVETETAHNFQVGVGSATEVGPREQHSCLMMHVLHFHSKSGK